jgi:cytochrome c peroxidase
MKRAGFLAILGTLLLCCAAPRPSEDGGADARPPPSDARTDAAIPENPHCRDDVATVSYPPGPHEINDDAVLPDLAFDDGEGGRVQLSRYFEPCAREARFLVLRQMAAWSGPSQWHAAHTARALRELGPRVSVLDLLALGRDNLPATADELRAWRRRYEPSTYSSQRVVLDPSYTLRAVYIGLRHLPVIIVVDVRTMRALRIFTGPDQHALDEGLAAARARAERRAPPAHRPHEDPHELAEDQWDMLRAMATLGPPPPSLTNRYADDPRAASLGERLFNDPGLSTGGVSCASCHIPSRDFVDARAVGVGVAFARGTRNTPTVRYAPYTQWLLWDGRADSLWSQALGPIENPVEMRSSRLRVAHVLFERYRAEYEAIFGSLPPLDERSRFAAEGGPGDPSYESMTEADRRAIDRVFANVGKAIEAYERTLRFEASAVDRYAMGQRDALSADARAGLHHFFANGCAQCHHGPMLTDDSFHNIRMPSGLPDGQGDRGWIDGLGQARASPFNGAGPFSDDPLASEHLRRLPSIAPVEALGMMHTPGLRGVSRTGPWGHGGRFTRLEDVVLHYASSERRRRVTAATGDEDLHLSDFHQDEQTVRELTAFLQAL